MHIRKFLPFHLYKPTTVVLIHRIKFLLINASVRVESPSCNKMVIYSAYKSTSENVVLNESLRALHFYTNLTYWNGLSTYLYALCLVYQVDFSARLIKGLNVNELFKKRSLF